MLQDATSSHPADPLLANALRRSSMLMREESEFMFRLMSQAAAENPDFQGGELIRLSDGQEFQFVKPNKIKDTADTIDIACTSLCESLTKAATLEEQESILLSGMREVMDHGLLFSGSPRTAHSAIATIVLAFEEYSKSGEQRSRMLLDMKNNLQYYARICYDTLECTSALLQNLPDNRLPGSSHYASSFYGVASLRYSKTHPHVAGGDQIADPGTDLHGQAIQVLGETLEPYLDVLPMPVSTDMFGLILRCSEQVADRVYKENPPKLGQFRRVHFANDNGPQDSEIILDDPLIRLRVKTILGQLFARYPDAAASAENMAEASLALEELLVRDQQLHEQGGHSR